MEPMEIVLFIKRFMKNTILNKLKPRRYFIKHKGVTAGFISVVPQENNHSHITLISIQSKYRGLGLGGILLKRTIDQEFNKHKIDTIKLQSRPDTKQKFNITSWYKRFGFTSIDGNWMILSK